MIARITALRQARARADDLIFRSVCRDVLCCDTIKITHDGQSVGEDRLEELIERACALTPPTEESSPSPGAHVSGNGHHGNGFTESNGNGRRKRKTRLRP